MAATAAVPKAAPLMGGEPRWDGASWWPMSGARAGAERRGRSGWRAW